MRLKAIPESPLGHRYGGHGEPETVQRKQHDRTAYRRADAAPGTERLPERQDQVGQCHVEVARSPRGIAMPEEDVGVEQQRRSHERNGDRCESRVYASKRRPDERQDENERDVPQQALSRAHEQPGEALRQAVRRRSPLRDPSSIAIQSEPSSTTTARGPRGRRRRRRRQSVIQSISWLSRTGYSALDRARVSAHRTQGIIARHSIMPAAVPDSATQVGVGDYRSSAQSGICRDQQQKIDLRLFEPALGVRPRRRGKPEAGEQDADSPRIAQGKRGEETTRAPSPQEKIERPRRVLCSYVVRQVQMVRKTFPAT